MQITYPDEVTPTPLVMLIKHCESRKTSRPQTIPIPSSFTRVTWLELNWLIFSQVVINHFLSVVNAVLCFSYIFTAAGIINWPYGIRTLAQFFQQVVGMLCQFSFVRLGQGIFVQPFEVPCFECIHFLRREPAELYGNMCRCLTPHQLFKAVLCIFILPELRQPCRGN